MTLCPIVGEAVKRWGNSLFVRMVNPLKSSVSSSGLTVCLQLICRVVRQMTRLLLFPKGARVRI